MRRIQHCFRVVLAAAEGGEGGTSVVDSRLLKLLRVSNSISRIRQSILCSTQNRSSRSTSMRWFWLARGIADSVIQAALNNTVVSGVPLSNYGRVLSEASRSLPPEMLALNGLQEEISVIYLYSRRFRLLKESKDCFSTSFKRILSNKRTPLFLNILR